MASWKDGAAYAPVERPDGFATPKTAPLEEAPPYQATTPGAVGRPRAFDAQPQPPLAQLQVVDRVTRDPKESFTVASMLLSEAPAGPDGRDPRKPFTTSASRYNDELPPPTGRPLAPPSSQPLPPPTGRPLAPPSGSPWAPPGQRLPGQPLAWSGQGPRPYTKQPAGANATARGLIYAAAGLCVVGAILWGLAGLTLIVAGALTSQTTARTKHMWLIAIGLGALAFVINAIEPATGPLWGIASVGMGVAYLVLGLRER